MCIVFASPEGGKLPTMAELESGALANDDGAGVAWTHEGLLHWEKGLKHADVEKLIEAGMLKPPCIIHYRITSAGETCDALTHPFPITPEVQLDLVGETRDFPVLFHNGTVTNWHEEMKIAITSGKGTLKVPPGEWSDTRVLAYLVALYGRGYLEFIDGLAGDRVAMLQPSGAIHYFGQWHHKDGFYASNESYLVGRRGKGGFTQPTAMTVGDTSHTSKETTTSEETTSGSEEGSDTSLLYRNRAELQELVREMKGRSLVFGIEVRA